MTPEEKLERKRAYHREWQARSRAANPALHREIAQRSREKNREKLRNVSRVRYYRDVEKSRVYYRTKLAEKRQWIASIKLSRGCVDCGFKSHAEALQFDHLPQHEKKFNVGAATSSMSRHKILEEISKCEVRCSNCHAIKTALRRLNG